MKRGEEEGSKDREKHHRRTRIVKKRKGTKNTTYRRYEREEAEKRFFWKKRINQGNTVQEKFPFDNRRLPTQDELKKFKQRNTSERRQKQRWKEYES